jgi:membrane protease YdiL (CAAX protease family)
VLGLPVGRPVGVVVTLLGTFAPSVVGLLLTRRHEGPSGVRALIARATRGDVPWGWYVFAAGFLAAIKLVDAAIVRLVTGAWPRFGALPWIVIPFVIAVSTPVQAGEEIGWRGYALPRLASRLGLAWASLLLGVLWAVWHLPLFFVRDTDTYGQSFPLYLTQVVAISVVIAWLWARTRGSLLLPMLLHAAINNTKDIVPSGEPGARHTFGLSTSPVAWIGAALLWACAAGMLVWMARTEPRRAGRYADPEGP